MRRDAKGGWSPASLCRPVICPPVIWRLTPSIAHAEPASISSSTDCGDAGRDLVVEIVREIEDPAVLEHDVGVVAHVGIEPARARPAGGGEPAAEALLGERLERVVDGREAEPAVGVLHGDVEFLGRGVGLRGGEGGVDLLALAGAAEAVLAEERAEIIGGRVRVTVPRETRRGTIRRDSLGVAGGNGCGRFVAHFVEVFQTRNQKTRPRAQKSRRGSAMAEADTLAGNAVDRTCCEQSPARGMQPVPFDRVGSGAVCSGRWLRLTVRSGAS
jgi:hypothetical protein